MVSKKIQNKKWWDESFEWQPERFPAISKFYRDELKKEVKLYQFSGKYWSIFHLPLFCIDGAKKSEKFLWRKENLKHFEEILILYIKYLIKTNATVDLSGFVIPTSIFLDDLQFHTELKLIDVWAKRIGISNCTFNQGICVHRSVFSDEFWIEKSEIKKYLDLTDTLFSSNLSIKNTHGREGVSLNFEHSEIVGDLNLSELYGAHRISISRSFIRNSLRLSSVKNLEVLSVLGGVTGKSTKITDSNISRLSFTEIDAQTNSFKLEGVNCQHLKIESSFNSIKLYESSVEDLLVCKTKLSDFQGRNLDVKKIELFEVTIENLFEVSNLRQMGSANFVIKNFSCAKDIILKNIGFLADSKIQESKIGGKLLVSEISFHPEAEIDPDAFHHYSYAQWMKKAREDSYPVETNIEKRAYYRSAAKSLKVLRTAAAKSGMIELSSKLFHQEVDAKSKFGSDVIQSALYFFYSKVSGGGNSLRGPLLLLFCQVLFFSGLYFFLSEGVGFQNDLGLRQFCAMSYWEALGWSLNMTSPLEPPLLGGRGSGVVVSEAQACLQTHFSNLLIFTRFLQVSIFLVSLGLLAIAVRRRIKMIDE